MKCKFFNFETKMKPVYADSHIEAAEIFAEVISRKMYGKNGVVRKIKVYEYDQDYNALCVIATIEKWSEKSDEREHDDVYIHPRLK